MNKIMVIGGYGQVGRLICKNLVEMNRYVVVAGRSVEKSELLIAELGGEHLESRYVDVLNWEDHYLDDIETVVMATEMNNTFVLNVCLRNKVNYVDITPSGKIVDAIVKLRNRIEQSQSSVCIGVGIAPGVSNVLCEHLAKNFEKVQEINSYLMLGVGEPHGKNAVKWLVDNLEHSYYENNDSTRLVKSFSDGRNVFLDSNNKKKRYVRIDLADWHIMKEKHAEALVNSWYAYDVDSITRLFEVLQKIGVFRLLKYKKLKALFTKFVEADMKLMKKLHFGTDSYAIMVEVKGNVNEEYIEKREVFRGRENNRITAKMCALVADRISKKTTGFYYMDELVNREDIKI